MNQSRSHLPEASLPKTEQLEGVASLLEQSMAIISLVSSDLAEADSPHLKRLGESLFGASSLIQTATARLDEAIEASGDV